MRRDVYTADNGDYDDEGDDDASNCAPPIAAFAREPFYFMSEIHSRIAKGTL